MALSIKTDEADRLARDLATATHETITEAVTTALRERLERIQGASATSQQRFAEDLSALAARAAVHDRAGAADVLEWDEAGLPR